MTAAADPWVALGDRTRRGILVRVLERPRSVTELADGLPISRPAVSQHLRVLKEARLVQVRRKGKEHIYAARADGLAELRSELEGFWTQALLTFKRLAEDGQHTDDTDNESDSRDRDTRPE